MECKKCGSSNLYDNRADKQRGEKNAKWPDIKCKDCSHAVWFKREGQGGSPRGGARGGSPSPRTLKWTWSTLSLTYERCLKLAKKHVLAEQPKALPGDVIAACATLFIAASRDGVADIAPKAAPKPAAKEVAGETYDDFPEAGPSYPEEEPPF